MELNVDILKGLCLGTIEGLTEFLPVSSTAHLILGSKLLNLSNEVLTTNTIVVQASSVLALGVYFGRDYNTMQLRITPNFIYYSLICAGVFSTIALLLEDYVKKNLFSINGIILGLFLGSFLMGIALLIKQKKSDLNLWKSFLIGVVQALAIIPGVSRSGAAISGGILVGLSLKDSVRFSFIQAMILLSLASIYELFKSFYLVLQNIELISSSFFAGFISSFFAIHVLDKLGNKSLFILFIIYRTVLALFLLMY